MEIKKFNNEQTLRMTVLKKIEMNPASCELYNSLVILVADYQDEVGDYEIATYKLLAAIHAPECKNPEHRKSMAFLYDENAFD